VAQSNNEMLTRSARVNGRRAYELALLLGILPPGTSFQTDAKHVFWSSNELGDTLQDMLQSLVRIGALEYDPEDQRYR
jgi:hypothetical protein